VAVQAALPLGAHGHTGGMTSHTTKVGPKGQVVIPKEIRDQLGIRSGERVRIDREGGEVRVRRILSLDDLQGVFAGSETCDTAALEREHREETRREERAAKERR
jgi:AbrB family looped-hinge helix DNA binding protein